MDRFGRQPPNRRRAQSDHSESFVTCSYPASKLWIVARSSRVWLVVYLMEFVRRGRIHPSSR